MFKKIFLSWVLKNSKKEIDSYLSIFSELSPVGAGKVIGMAALIHYQYTQKDAKFDVLLSSKISENKDLISTRIIEINQLVNQMNRAQRLQDAAAMKLWNVTFRCMMDESFNHYGILLWETISNNFPHAKDWLETQLETTKNSGNESNARNLTGALKLYDYVPLQFVNSKRLRDA